MCRCRHQWSRLQREIQSQLLCGRHPLWLRQDKHSQSHHSPHPWNSKYVYLQTLAIATEFIATIWTDLWLLLNTALFSRHGQTSWGGKLECAHGITKILTLRSSFHTMFDSLLHHIRCLCLFHSSNPEVTTLNTGNTPTHINLLVSFLYKCLWVSWEGDLWEATVRVVSLHEDKAQLPYSNHSIHVVELIELPNLRVWKDILYNWTLHWTNISPSLARQMFSGLNFSHAVKSAIGSV